MNKYQGFAIILFISLQSVSMGSFATSSEHSQIHVRITDVKAEITSSKTSIFRIETEIWNAGSVGVNLPSYCGFSSYFSVNATASLKEYGNMSINFPEVTYSCLPGPSQISPGVTSLNFSKPAEFTNVSMLNGKLPDGDYRFSLFNSWNLTSLYQSYGAVLHVNNSNYNLTFDTVPANWGETSSTLSSLGTGIFNIILIGALGISVGVVLHKRKRN